jgi:uncharacterized protein YqgV (UPF0045/DUF77 family)
MARTKCIIQKTLYTPLVYINDTLNPNIVLHDENKSNLFYVKFDEEHDSVIKIEKKWRVQSEISKKPYMHPQNCIYDTLHHNIVLYDGIKSDLFYVKLDEEHDSVVKIEKKWRVQSVISKKP